MKTVPATHAAAPPTIIQTALSVGDPVKNLETSELKELVALMPKMSSTIPPTNRARAIGLFIYVYFSLKRATGCRSEVLLWIEGLTTRRRGASTRELQMATWG
jgi:hypothetical protein